MLLGDSALWLSGPFLQCGKGGLSPKPFTHLSRNHRFLYLEYFFLWALCIWIYGSLLHAEFLSYFLFLNEKDESLRYCKEEDSLLGIASNSFLWGRPAVEAEWGGFTEVVTRSGFGPNIVEKCSEETQST